MKKNVAIITGASSGIGFSLAKNLAARGYIIGLISRQEKDLHTRVNQIYNNGGIAQYSVADVSNEKQITNAIHSLISRLGGINILIANAGISRTDFNKDSSSLNIDDIELMMKVNYLGVVYSFNTVTPLMLKNKSGCLVAISSLTAYKGFPNLSGYCASKAAVNVFLEGLRVQLLRTGISIKIICPGFVRTPMSAVNKHPMPFSMDPDQAAFRIVNTILSNKKISNFPWPLVSLVMLSKILPDWVIAYARTRKD